MTQAVAVMTELQRLSSLGPTWEWTGSAVIAREWKYLEPVQELLRTERHSGADGR